MFLYSRQRNELEIAGPLHEPGDSSQRVTSQNDFLLFIVRPQIERYIGNGDAQYNSGVRHSPREFPLPVSYSNAKIIAARRPIPIVFQVPTGLSCANKASCRSLIENGWSPHTKLRVSELEILTHWNKMRRCKREKSSSCVSNYHFSGLEAREPAAR